MSISFPQVLQERLTWLNKAKKLFESFFFLKCIKILFYIGIEPHRGFFFGEQAAVLCEEKICFL